MLLINQFVRGAGRARKGVWYIHYITHPGLFNSWSKQADLWLSIYLLSGPIMVLGQSEEKQKLTFSYGLAGGLEAAIGGR